MKNRIARYPTTAEDQKPIANSSMS
jgi:hypothetical protein